VRSGRNGRSQHHTASKSSRYVVPFTKEELKAARADSLDKLTRADGAAAYSQSANSYYKVS
jgi:hypothetical protein